MKKIKGVLLPLFLFPFFLFAQGEAHLFQSLNDYKKGKSTPAEQVFVEKRKNKEINRYGGSDYKVYAANKKLSSMLETFYWGVLKEDSLFVNCKQLSLATGYAFAEQIGNDLFLMLPENAKFNTSRDGGISGVDEENVRYVYYIMDLIKGTTKPLNKNRMVELLSFNTELVNQYLNEPDWRDAYTQRKYLIATQQDTKTVQELIVQRDSVIKAPAKKQNQFISLVRFKPLATIMGAILGIFDFEMAAAIYVHPKIGIPVEFQIAYANQVAGIALMTGIEAVPVTHREKSGLYLNYELGGMYINTGKFGFCTMGHIGYQLVTKKGFVFTPAIGCKYDTIDKKVGLHIMLDIGFALKRR